MTSAEGGPPAPGYPILLRLGGQRCLIVGGGKVATRKCEGLLEARAEVIVISPEATARLKELADAGAIQLEKRGYTTGLIAAYGPLLVFAATDDPAVNRQVVDEARQAGALADSVDANAGLSDFSSMPVVRRGPVTVAIATGGASPALAAHLRGRVETAVGPEYGRLAEWLADLRPTVRGTVRDAADRQRLWQAILESEVLERLRQGDAVGARAAVDAILARFGGPTP